VSASRSSIARNQGGKRRSNPSEAASFNRAVHRMVRSSGSSSLKSVTCTFSWHGTTCCMRPYSVSLNRVRSAVCRCSTSSKARLSASVSRGPWSRHPQLMLYAGLPGCRRSTSHIRSCANDIGLTVCSVNDTYPASCHAIGAVRFCGRAIGPAMVNVRLLDLEGDSAGRNTVLTLTPGLWNSCSRKFPEQVRCVWQPDP
jgi:hypothetical protein